MTVLAVLAVLVVLTLFIGGLGIADAIRQDVRAISRAANRIADSGIVTRLPGEAPPAIPPTVLDFAARITDSVERTTFLDPDVKAALLDLISDQAAAAAKDTSA